MKQRQSIKLSIPQSCHESWSNMTPADKGRFCLNCQQTVTDFTKLSDKEIIELLQNKQATTCGRFLPDQLNRTLIAPAREKQRKPFISIAAIAAALTITIPFAKAANPPETTQYTIDNEDKQTAAIFSGPIPTRYISGTVTSAGDGLPLPVIVKIQNTTAGIQADQNGNFKLRIPETFKEQIILLEVSFIGFKKKIIKVSLKKELKPLRINLEEDVTTFGEYGIHFEADKHKKDALWARVGNTIKKVFG